jgi:hypothetical protein
MQIRQVQHARPACVVHVAQRLCNVTTSMGLAKWAQLWWCTYICSSGRPGAFIQRVIIPMVGLAKYTAKIHWVRYSLEFSQGDRSSTGSQIYPSMRTVACRRGVYSASQGTVQPLIHSQKLEFMEIHTQMVLSSFHYLFRSQGKGQWCVAPRSVARASPVQCLLWAACAPCEHQRVQWSWFCCHTRHACWSRHAAAPGFGPNCPGGTILVLTTVRPQIIPIAKFPKPNCLYTRNYIEQLKFVLSEVPIIKFLGINSGCTVVSAQGCVWTPHVLCHWWLTVPSACRCGVAGRGCCAQRPATNRQPKGWQVLRRHSLDYTSLIKLNVEAWHPGHCDVVQRGVRYSSPDLLP